MNAAGALGIRDFWTANCRTPVPRTLIQRRPPHPALRSHDSSTPLRHNGDTYHG